MIVKILINWFHNPYIFTQVTLLHEISKCLEDFNEFAEDVRRFAPSGKMVVPPMKQEPKGAC